jgi:hypothetical protein
LARGLGAWKYGDANRGETICPVPMAGEGVPQLSQNLLSAVKLVPQTAQRIPNASPHSRQNRASSRFSCRHLRHCITRPPASGAAYDQTAGLPDRDSRDLFKLRSGLSGSRLPWGPLAAMAAPRALGIEVDSHRHDIMARVRHVAPNPSQRHQPACKPGSVGCRPLALTICDGRFINCEERVAKGARSSPDRDAFANHHICSWGTSRSTADVRVASLNAGVKFADIWHVGPTGHGHARYPQATVTKEPDHRGSTKETVKTIACGNAGCPAYSW